MNKRDILELVQAMPEEIDLDELMYRLYLKQKLQAAEAAFQEGRVIPHDEAVRWSQAWFRCRAGGPAADPRLHRQ